MFLLKKIKNKLHPLSAHQKNDGIFLECEILNEYVIFDEINKKDHFDS